MTKRYFVSRIGCFRPSESPRLSAARRAFGAPSERKLIGGACRVDWRGIRLRIVFANFRGARPGQTVCTPSVGRTQTFVARGSRSRTIKGLRVAASSATIPFRHPEAEFQPNGSWALVQAVFPFGDDEPQPVLSALVRSGRVAALRGYIGGAGE